MQWWRRRRWRGGAVVVEEEEFAVWRGVAAGGIGPEAAAAGVVTSIRTIVFD